MVALFSAEREGIDPFSVRGSSAGAFGLPQFLPQLPALRRRRQRRRQVSLYDPDDAIASAANYLRATAGIPAFARRTAQGHLDYNHSDAYIDTVLWLAGQIEQVHASAHAFEIVDHSPPSSAAPRAAKPKPHRKPKTKPKPKPKPKRRKSNR